MPTIDAAIEANLPRAVELLADLVRRPSVLGDEAEALAVLERAWIDAAFTTSHVGIPERIAAHEGAGVPRLGYDGRYDVVGRRGSGPRSLLLNGHIDVVPAEDLAAWSNPPFTPAITDGWMLGRGAGDMKAGFAAGLLAIWALDEAQPGWLGDGTLSMVAAIEEECTGNGTLASLLAGHTADAVLLLEPTDLELLLAGIGIVWVTIEVDGRSGHAEAAAAAANPILAARPVLDALEAFERDLNGAGDDPVFPVASHPYNVNVGSLHAGDWPSSVASTARIEVRVGHPRGWTSDEAFARVQAAVLEATATDAWLSVHPPRFALTGFRAQGYAQVPEAEVVQRLSAAHRDAHGGDPAIASTAATTDARFYVNQYGIPAVAYGPRTRNMHGADEAVEIASVADTARTVARFLREWFSA